MTRKCPACLVPVRELKTSPFFNTNADIVPVPCKNDIFGCEAELLLKDMPAHMATCRFVDATCMIGCPWEGKLEEMIPHLQSHAKIHFVDENVSNCVVNLNLAQCTDWHMVFIIGGIEILMHAALGDAIFSIRFQSHLSEEKMADCPKVKVRFNSFTCEGLWSIHKAKVKDVRKNDFVNAIEITLASLIDNFIKDDHIVFEIKFY